MAWREIQIDSFIPTTNPNFLTSDIREYNWSQRYRTTDITGVCNLPAGTEMCMPGDNVEMTIELIHPIAMEQGLRFAIREGGRTVGSGRVATIIE